MPCRRGHVRMRDVFDLFKDTFESWNKDNAQRLGAALSYYTVFSLGPLLIIMIALVGLIFGRAAVQGMIVNQVQGLVGSQGAQFVQTAIASAYNPGEGIIAAVIGVVTLILGALGIFGELQGSLNTIWGVQLKPTAGWRGMIQQRLLSFAMVLAVGFLLLVSLVASAALSAFSGYLGSFLPMSAAVLQGFYFFFSLVVITILFALIFKYLPDAEIAWRNVWVGAAITALLFTVGKYVLGLYLGQSRIISAYGAAGSVIIILVWVYYSAQILFFGAEFTQAFAKRYGKGIVPAPNAERIIKEVHA